MSRTGGQDPDDNFTSSRYDADGNLLINVAAGGSTGGGFSDQDASGYTAGLSEFVPVGGARFDAPADVADGQTAAARITAKRAVHSNLRDNSGVEAGTLTNPLRVDPTGTTAQPVSAVSLPLPSGASTEATLSSLNGKVTAVNTGAVVVSSSALPSGAATAAKQPALGTAGTASADVLTVQGIASMTALKVDGSAVTQPVSAASLPLPTLAATSTKQSDGTQKTQVVDGSGNVIASTANALNVNISSGNPTTITATQATGTNLHTVVDSGTITTVSAVTAISNALPAGTNAIGKLAANSGVDIGDVDVLSVPADPFGVNADAASATGSISAKLRFIAATGIPITALPTLASVTTVSTVTNLAQMGGQAIALNTGTRSAGTQRVTIATDDIVPASQSGTWTVQPGNTANTTPWLVTETSVGLTGNAPAAATIGVTSSTVIAANASRKGLILTNTSNNVISLAFGTSAVLNSGITLQPGGGTFTMDKYSLSTAQINAIAGAASSNLAIQEFQ